MLSFFANKKRFSNLRIFMKKTFLLVVLCLLCACPLFSQKFGISTNLAYWALTTPNIGLDIGLGQKTSLEIAGLYNPFKFKNNKQMKGWAVQPEFRIWTCRRYNGHFFGLHAHYADYNGGLKTYRYDGWLVGGGFSYGYSWLIGKRWNLETEIGVGYAYMNYDKYKRIQHLTREKPIGQTRNYIGPTKAAITFIYFIK